MLDRAVRRRIDPCLERAAAQLGAVGIAADWVTWFGFVIGVGAAAAIAADQLFLALLLLFGNRLCDGLDGALARRSAPTDRGAYLDIVLDFLFYALFVFAFAWRDPADALAAAYLILSFVGTGTSFLAHAIFVAKRGGDAVMPRKGIAYIGGLTEGTETILVFVLMLLLPAHFAKLAWIFGALCWLTTASRIATTLAALRR
jgi:phosphatidylglycerophosphate synthase